MSYTFNMIAKIIVNGLVQLILKIHYTFIFGGLYVLYLGLGEILISDYEIIDCNLKEYNTSINKRDKYKDNPTIKKYKMTFEYYINGKVYEGWGHLYPERDKELLGDIFRGELNQKLYISKYNHRWNQLYKPSEKTHFIGYLFLLFPLSLITLGCVPELIKRGVIKSNKPNIYTRNQD